MDEESKPPHREPKIQSCSSVSRLRPDSDKAIQTTATASSATALRSARKLGFNVRKHQQRRPYEERAHDQAFKESELLDKAKSVVRSATAQRR